MADVLETLQSLVSENLEEFQVLAGSLPDIWTVLIIPAVLGLCYCFFGCKRWMRRLLGGFLGLAIFSLLTFALTPRLFDLSPTALLVSTVVAGLLGALILSFGNIILEFLAYFLVFRFALHLLTDLGPTACVVIATVLAWAICIAFIKNRMVPTAVAGAALCGLASMYFGNIVLSAVVFLVLLALGLLSQWALLKAAREKEAGEEAMEAEAAEPSETAVTQVLEAHPDLTGIPSIPETDTEVIAQVEAAVEEPRAKLLMAAEAGDGEESVEDDLEEDLFFELEKNITFGDLQVEAEPPRATVAKPPASPQRKRTPEKRGTLVAATALATTVLALVSLGLMKTFKRD